MMIGPPLEDKIIEAALPPRHTSLKAANEEIQILHRLLFAERKRLVKVIGQRELDKRSMAGQIRAERKSNEDLRNQLRELRARLEKLITKDTAL